MTILFPQLSAGAVVVGAADYAAHMDKLLGVFSEMLERVIDSADDKCPDDLTSALRRHIDDLQRLLVAAPRLSDLLSLPLEAKVTHSTAYHAWVDDVGQAGHAMISELSREMRRIFNDDVRHQRRAARRAGRNVKPLSEAQGNEDRSR
jgi:hypothetical protein